MADLYTALGWIGRRIYDVHGARIGKVEDIFVDRGTPRWLAVNAGAFRRREVAVSADDVLEEPEGRLHVPYERATLGEMRAALERSEGINEWRRSP